MMTIKLLRAGDPSQTPIEERRFAGGRLTIGRAPECDWVIKDPTRAVSKIHCELFNRGSQAFVSDESTNGTFLNDQPSRIDRLEPTPVRIGDRLKVGDYILVLAPDTGLPRTDDIFADPLPQRQNVRDIGPIDWDTPRSVAEGVTDRGRRSAIDDLIGDIGGPLGHSAPARTEIPEPTRGRGELSAAFQEPLRRPAPPAAGAIPEDWSLDPLAPLPPSPGPGPAAASSPPIARLPDDFDLGFGEEPAKRAAPPPAPAFEPLVQSEAPRSAASGEPSRLLEAFLTGAGLSPAEFADLDGEAILKAAGASYREAVLSYSQILRDRSFLRNEFRIERTLIGVQGNNPLKFFDPEEAVAKLLRPPEKGFLDAAAAIRQAGDDVKKHQISVLSGLRFAFQALLDRFKPAAILAHGGTDKSSLSLLGGEGQRVRRAWERFTAIYESCEDEATTGQDGFLNQAFRRGYEEQITKLDQP